MAEETTEHGITITCTPGKWPVEKWNALVVHLQSLNGLCKVTLRLNGVTLVGKSDHHKTLRLRGTVTMDELNKRFLEHYRLNTTDEEKEQV